VKQKVDFMGLSTDEEITKKLKKYEEENTATSILFLSDVWLDKDGVFDKLSELFEAYNSVRYIYFIFPIVIH
jgi:hypothetical protein